MLAVEKHANDWREFFREINEQPGGQAATTMQMSHDGSRMQHDQTPGAAESSAQIRSAYATPGDLFARYDRRAVAWLVQDNPPTPSVPESPKAIQDLASGDVQQRMVEVWGATNRLLTAIDAWQDWFRTLRERGDADPAIAMACQSTARQSIHLLCVYRVSAAPFNRSSEDEIAGMLPSLPLWSMGEGGPSSGWQEDPNLLSDYFGAEGRCATANQLRAAVAGLHQMLEQYPLAIWAPSTPNDASIAVDDQICLSVTEAARFVGVSDHTIRNWQAKHKLTTFKDERGIIFAKSELELLKRNRR